MVILKEIWIIEQNKNRWKLLTTDCKKRKKKKKSQSRP